MTSLLEKIISVIAPHRCLVCGNYNNVICTACVQTLHHPTPFCVLCGASGIDWRLCRNCAPHSALGGVWVAGLYEQTLQQAIKQFKFDHARAAHQPFAAMIAANLPYFDKGWCVAAVPTVASHIRQRGYDHAALIAKSVAKHKRLPYITALSRIHDARQVGAGRSTRQKQAAHVFKARRAAEGYKVLLIDDVCTTGATLSAAAKALKKAGAVEVWGAVVAWQPKEHK